MGQVVCNDSQINLIERNLSGSEKVFERSPSCVISAGGRFAPTTGDEAEGLRGEGRCVEPPEILQARSCTMPSLGGGAFIVRSITRSGRSGRCRTSRIFMLRRRGNHFWTLQNGVMRTNSPFDIAILPRTRGRTGGEGKAYANRKSQG